jgi:hypothetical protein
VTHPLVRAVSAALPRPRPADAAAYLRLLDRRLRWLEARAEGQPRAGLRLAATAAERAMARRLLRRLEGGWDDGDENLVRGHLDGAGPDSGDPGRDAARGLVAAAAELAGIRARPGTLFFYLWALESMLTSPGDIAMIPAVPRKRTPRGGR